MNGKFFQTNFYRILQDKKKRNCPRDNYINLILVKMNNINW